MVRLWAKESFGYVLWQFVIKTKEQINLVHAFLSILE